MYKRDCYKYNETYKKKVLRRYVQLYLCRYCKINCLWHRYG